MPSQFSDVYSLSESAEASAFCGRRCQRLLAASAELGAFGNAADTASGPDAPAGPDVHLIADCITLDALERRVDAINDPTDPDYIDDDDVRDCATAPIEAEQAPLMERICTSKAVTRAGHRARVHSLLLRHKAIDPAVDAVAPHRSWDDRLIAATLRDLSD